MNEKIIKPGVIKRIVDLTKSRNQKYTQETVSDILTAFFDVVEDAIDKGDSINLNGYMTIELQHREQRKALNVKNNTVVIVPEHYRVHIKSGAKFNQAAENFTERKLNTKDE